MSLAAVVYSLLGALSVGLVVDMVLSRRREPHGGESTAEDSSSPGSKGEIVSSHTDGSSADEPLRVFISAPMTSTSNAESTRIRYMTSRLTTDLLGLGFEVTTPSEMRPLAEDWSAAIRQELSRADAVLVLAGERASLGVGAEVAYASQALVPVALMQEESATLSTPMTSLGAIDVLTFQTADEASARAMQWLAALAAELRARRSLRLRAVHDIEPLRLSLLRELNDSSALANIGMSQTSLANLLSEPTTFAGARLSEITAISQLVGKEVSNYIEPHARTNAGGTLTEAEWSALMTAAVLSDWSPLEITALVERRVSSPALDATVAARTSLTSATEWRRFFDEHLNERSS